MVAALGAPGPRDLPMTSPLLPSKISGYLASRLESVNRSELKTAQAAMSDAYRAGGHSRTAVPDATAVLAYALARMPATYAACVRAFDLSRLQAKDFVPRTVLDLGAGPGTAALAACAVWPELERAHLLEPNAALADVARDLLATTTLAPTHQAGDLSEGFVAEPVDLLTLSYVLAEQPEAEIANIVARAAAKTLGMIIIVEPGTPAGYKKVLAARAALIEAGLTIAAPCPHASDCPLPNGDWCHFSVRLQRSAAHMQLKDARVPFEDERFSFVTATRGTIAVPSAARLLRPAQVEKGYIDLVVCGRTGLETRRVRRRDATDYKWAKSLQWGDAV